MWHFLTINPAEMSFVPPPPLIWYTSHWPLFTEIFINLFSSNNSSKAMLFCGIEIWSKTSQSHFYILYSCFQRFFCMFSIFVDYPINPIIFKLSYILFFCNNHSLLTFMKHIFPLLFWLFRRTCSWEYLYFENKVQITHKLRVYPPNSYTKR